MSFSVKAVESPSPQLSPYMHPYVSPQMLPQPGPRPPSMSLNEDHMPVKRVGTDPTKYKTTICRNWEQTGTCTFRGCTFAHGVEELRPPMRLDHGNTPVLHSQYVSPGSTPPLLAAQANHFSNGGPPKLEALLELLQAEVSRERELVQVHMEANRTLEGMLRREQAQHAETRAQLEERTTEYAMLLQVVAQQNAILQTFMQPGEDGYDGTGCSDFTPQAAAQAEALMQRTTAFMAEAGVDGFVERPASNGAAGSREGPGMEQPSPHSSEAGDTKDEEKDRIEELLRALQGTS